MLTASSLLQALGRVLLSAGLLSIALGLMLILISPPNLAGPLGGWFLSVGAVAALVSVVPRYIASRFEDISSRNSERSIRSGFHTDDVFDRSPLASSPDRSGIFGGDCHQDQLDWRAMKNSEERGW